MAVAPLVCPQDYSCQFTQIHPRIITVTHNIGPWWHGMWGIIVAIIAIIAIAVVLGMIVTYSYQAVVDKRNRIELEKGRQQKMALEEQRTMQLDAAKGNPDMLKVVQGWDRNRY